MFKMYYHKYMTETYQLIPIKQIQTNPYQPRQHFNKEKLAELAQSIKENGIIQPLIVRPSSIIGFELMAGERRLRASQLAGLETVPVIIKPLSDYEMMTQAIIENLQRHDLSPIEEAKAYQNLVQQGNTHEIIAKTLGKSRPYISNSIRLLNLSDRVLQALEEEKISSAHARTLLTFQSHDLQELWLDKILTEHISVRELETLVSKKKTKRKPVKIDVFIKNAEQTLSQQLGTSVTIKQHQQGHGQIKIEFASLEELNRLIHSLK